MDQNYIPPMRMSQPAPTSAYAQTTSSSPSLYQSRTLPESSSSSRRHSEMPSSSADQAYGRSYRRISNPYDSASSSQYSMTTGQTIPSISGLTQSPLPSPHLGSTSNAGGNPLYNSSLARLVHRIAVRYSHPTLLTAFRSPGLYESGMYAQAYSTPSTSAPLYTSSQSLSYLPPFMSSGVNAAMAKPLGSDSSIRVINQRPKPQCWDHGCNGRQFSTFSNLLRHQREKSGTAAKSYCPKCGAEFTRTTARNGHLAHDKCTKPGGSSDDK